MARIARLLGVTLDYLAGHGRIHPQSLKVGDQALIDHASSAMRAQIEGLHENLTADGLLRLHAKSGARIEAFADFLDRADRYNVPTYEDGGLHVIEVGARSLSALTMGENNLETLQQALDLVTDDGLRRRWVTDYAMAGHRGTLVTLEALDVQMPNKPVRVRIEFVRTLLCVQDVTGNRSILNFSLLVV
ncbi:hypothetical protein [Mesobacterium pallidum]|uniref:hypothetical protein n=1 Tax=Mesobacterium pallidum TaxID=2872037 RepID=UPI001EE1A269|nr:hypothetical protein [Mesobacterium pallidum]